MFTARTMHFEISDRTRGISHGGIGTFHLLAPKLGLIERIDRRLHVLHIHLPYHESDHVLNFASNALCDGTCLQDLARRRHDANFLDALGARRRPDPTTAGDCCRRFTPERIATLQDLCDDTRRVAWADQPAEFFRQATLDRDGTRVPTDAEYKQGVDLAYDGTWGYHPLVVTLANPGEVRRVVNRPGRRPSHEGAAAQVDKALAVGFQGGFRRVLLRGDTDFSQTEHLDRWDEDKRVQFRFGYDALPNLKAIADRLPAHAWQPLQRPVRYAVKTQPRRRRKNVKEASGVERGFVNLKLRSEAVAEFNYRPVAGRKTYRLVVLRKNIAKEKGELRLFEEVRSFCVITNDWVSDLEELVQSAHGRCHQENLLAQLKRGVPALRTPVDNLVSNWAYMVMTALAWNLKAWWALTLPERPGRWQEQYRAEKRWVLGLAFKAFANAFVRLPCQIVRTGRRLLDRLLSWNPYQRIFFRMVSVLRC
jgi:hypothetical protein